MAGDRFVALGGTGEPDRRPRVTTSRPRSVRGNGGRGRRLSRDSNGNRVARGGWLRGEAAGHQVLIGGAPDRAGRLLLTPAGRADPAVTAVVRLVVGEHRPPALGQPGKF